MNSGATHASSNNMTGFLNHSNLNVINDLDDSLIIKNQINLVKKRKPSEQPAGNRSFIANSNQSNIFNGVSAASNQGSNSTSKKPKGVAAYRKQTKP